jgi:hypothetical protein
MSGDEAGTRVFDDEGRDVTKERDDFYWESHVMEKEHEGGS